MSELRPVSGASIPPLGLGTFGSDRYGPSEVAQAVRVAAELGYRHFDCAAVYGNEREVGAALRETGLNREDFWVTSKVWNNRHEDAEQAAEDSLRDLGLDYLDLYLIHWPLSNHHGVGVGVDSRDPHAVPYSHDRYMKVWASLERLVERGLVRSIGTSNMTVRKLGPVLEQAAIRPFANQMELHPHFQQPEFFAFLNAHGVLPIGYSPLGSPSRPERDRTPEDTSPLDDPVILRIAEARGIRPAEVCIRWAVSRGQTPIPFSVKRDQMEASLRAAMAEPLDADEMQAIEAIDRNCRLIKGQVFLWPSAIDWPEIWDEEPGNGAD